MVYGKVHPVGHKNVKDVFDGPVMVQEKVDGSQFSFGMLGVGLCCYSKNRELDMNGNNGMFNLAVEYVKSKQHLLGAGELYFCEYLARPKHNVLKYNRTPRHGLVLFDIFSLDGPRPMFSIAHAAELLDIDAIPVLAHNTPIRSREELRRYLDTESYLGGTKVEGVVCKRITANGKLITAKLVSDAFKEISGRACAPKGERVDIIQELADAIATDARFEKVLQHVREAGHIGGVPEDLPRLMKELGKDLGEEGMDYVRDQLFVWGWRQVQKQVMKKLPPWYLAKLDDDLPKGCC